MCPYYLDGDLGRAVRAERARRPVAPIRPVIPVPPALIEYGWLWLLCSFQGPSERATRAYAGTVAGDGRRGLSKLNSMHGLELGGMPRRPGQVRSTC